MKFSIQQLSELVKKAKAEPSTEDLMKRPCCGSGCTNCPYSPRHKKGNTKVREELKKEAKIVKDKKSGKWILYTKDGSRILGKHENAQDAYKQEYAIEKSMEKKANPQQAASGDVDLVNEMYNPTTAAGIANLYTHSKQVAMASEAAQIGSKPGAKRLLTNPGPLMPQLKAVGKVAQPVAAAIDTAVLVASPQARQNAVNAVEQDARLDPALRMGKAYLNPISTGYGIAMQANQMAGSTNAAQKSMNNYSNALDRYTANRYYDNYGLHQRAAAGNYTFPNTTKTFRQNQMAAPANQLAKGASAEPKQYKEDIELRTVTKPLKTPRSGFTTDLKKGKIAVPDRRFNLIEGAKKMSTKEKQPMEKESNSKASIIQKAALLSLYQK